MLRILLNTLSFSLVWTTLVHAAPLTVCTATINSSDEKQVFQSKLNPQDFKFVELTDYSTQKNDSTGWFDNACEAQVQCDVLIFSGHFGGSFFGSSRFRLGLGDLERNSCSRCGGILERPKEVFLFGCNTLASKDKDQRTPEQYLQVLLEHNRELSRVEAERIVASRYSPIGASFRDRIERIFENVPMIYGFSSVSPTGANVRGRLTSYLNEVGDYRKHLESIAAGSRDSRIYEKNLSAFSVSVTEGVTKSKSDYEVKENTCRMSDASVPLTTRADFAASLLEKNSLLYFPTVANFVSRNFTTDPENLLSRFTNNPDLKSQMSKFANVSGLGIYMQLDLLKLSRSVKWISEETYNQKLRAVLTPMIQTPTEENRDVICSLRTEKVLFNVTLEDLNLKNNFHTAHGLSTLACLPTTDERITREFLKAAEPLVTNAQMNLSDKIYTLGNILDFPGLYAEKRALVQKIPTQITGRYAPLYHYFILGLSLATATEEEQQRIFDQNYRNGQALSFMSYYLSKNPHVVPALDIRMTQIANDTCGRNSCVLTYKPQGTSPEFQAWYAKNKLSLSPYTRKNIEGLQTN